MKEPFTPLQQWELDDLAEEHASIRVRQCARELKAARRNIEAFRLTPLEKTAMIEHRAALMEVSDHMPEHLGPTVLRVLARIIGEPSS